MKNKKWYVYTLITLPNDFMKKMGFRWLEVMNDQINIQHKCTFKICCGNFTPLDPNWVKGEKVSILSLILFIVDVFVSIICLIDLHLFQNNG